MSLPLSSYYLFFICIFFFLFFTFSICFALFVWANSHFLSFFSSFSFSSNALFFILLSFSLFFSLSLFLIYFLIFLSLPLLVLFIPSLSLSLFLSLSLSTHTHTYSLSLFLFSFSLLSLILFFYFFSFFISPFSFPTPSVPLFDYSIWIFSYNFIQPQIATEVYMGCFFYRFCLSFNNRSRQWYLVVPSISVDAVPTRTVPRQSGYLQPPNLTSRVTCSRQQLEWMPVIWSLPSFKFLDFESRWAVRHLSRNWGVCLVS